MDRFRQNLMADLSLRWMSVRLLALACQDVLSRLIDRRDYPDFVLDAAKIPINRSYMKRHDISRSHTMAVTYGTAIAPRLSQVLHRDACEIASELVARLQDSVIRDADGGVGHSDLESLMAPYRSFTVMPTGWIVMKIADAGVAAWLQDCRSRIRLDGRGGTALGGFPGEQTVMPMGVRLDAATAHAEDVLWRAQYAHARCCACLRMASEVGIDVCQPLPWLQGDRLRLHSIPERQLLNAILDTVDDVHDWWMRVHAGQHDLARQNRDLDQGSIDQDSHEGAPNPAYKGAIAPKVVVKRLQTLSDDVLTFYAECRMFGDVLTGDRPLATTRLGLLLIAQTLLRTLLEGVLNEVALTSL